MKFMKSMQHAVENAKNSSTNFSSTKNRKGCCSLAWLHWQFFASSGWLCSLLEEIGTASWRLVAGARILRRFQRPWSNVPRMPREAAGGNGWTCSCKMQGKFWWKYWICHLVSGAKREMIFEPERNTILSQMYGWNLVTVVLLQSLLRNGNTAWKLPSNFHIGPKRKTKEFQSDQVPILTWRLHKQLNPSNKKTFNNVKKIQKCHIMPAEL